MDPQVSKYFTFNYKSLVQLHITKEQFLCLATFVVVLAQAEIDSIFFFFFLIGKIRVKAFKFHNCP
jgi:hypothetical protein